MNDTPSSKKAAQLNKSPSKSKSNASPGVAEMNALASVFNQGLQAESLALALDMTKQFSEHGFGWKVLGAIYQQQGLPDQASPALKMAAQLLPNDSEVHYNLANVLCDQDQLQEAVVSYQKAIKINAGFTQAHYNLGSVFKELGRLEEAEASFKQALKQAPDNELMYSNLGIMLNDQGRFKEAEEYYRRALEINPDFTQIHYNLGCNLLEQARFAEAEICFVRALELDVNFVEAYCNLSIVYQHLQRDEAADANLRKAIALKPDYADAHFNLANRLLEQGQLDEAEACYRNALAANSEFSMAYNNLGTVLKARGRLSEAEACYKKSIELTPEFSGAYNNLGVVLKEQGQLSEVEASYRRAVELNPNSPEAYNNLGIVLKDKGRLAEAEVNYRQALTINPAYAIANCNLSLVLEAQARYAEAEACLRLALNETPDFPEAYNNLGIVFSHQGRLAEAEASFLHAIAIKPDYVDAYNNLGCTLKDVGRLVEAEGYYRKALKINPDFIVAKSNLLFSMNYSAIHSTEECLDEARQYGHMVSAKVAAKFDYWQCPLQAKRLRVGLVSGDLRQHAVAYFLENVVQHIDASIIEFIAYASDSREDALTARLKPHFLAWKTLVGLSDQEAARLIQADGVHVLLDLSGHTADNRLPVFAWKPAPVQASWLGYFATTGVEEMDYFIADEIGVPQENQQQFVERIKYLPDTRLCFTAPNVEISVSPLPALSNEYITFGCFQNMAKVGDEVLALWAEVMQAMPNAKLRWQCKSLLDPIVVERVKQRFVQCGLNLDRVTLLGAVSREAYFAVHAEVDVLLDVFPFNGGTTTCEALWLGVPTLTLVGETLIARQGASLLTAAGLDDWVAASKVDYVSKAVSLTSDFTKLASLRAGLRAHVLASPLFDAPRFARNMETALWEMWNDAQNINSRDQHEQNVHQPLIQHVDDVTNRLLKPSIEIISATRFSESDFWSKSALGISLKRQLEQDPRLLANIAFDNTRGLPGIFNDCIDQAEDDAVLIFIHDDVWIDEKYFADRVIEGLGQFDVIGVAGNRRRVLNQPAWLCVDNNFTWDKPNLSGRVAHGPNAFGGILEFGAVPAECELLDGVFLATKKSSLKQFNVRFDPQFDFHFYDMDFCRSARQAGLRLGTWAVNLTHQSDGAFGSLGWEKKYQLYLSKWDDAFAIETITSSQDRVMKHEQDLQQAVNDVLQMALDHQNAGQIEEAESLYQEVLKIQPKHAQANHNLGVIEAHSKGALVAVARLEIAVMEQPENEQFWVSYIDALMQSGAVDETVSALELGQQYGLKKETAQMMAAEFIQGLESKQQASSPKSARVNAKVAVISMVKDECDIIELFVKINAKVVDHIFIVDHNSKDKTLEILWGMREKGYPLTIYRNDSLHFQQALILTSLLHEVANTNEFDYIVPLDADELIHCDQGGFAKFLVDSIPNGNCGLMAWRTYIPVAGDYYASHAPLYDVFRQRSKENKQFYKVVIPNGLGKICVIKEGNHHATINGKLLPATKISTILQHIPIRSVDQLIAKVLINSQRLSIKEGRGKTEGVHWMEMADKIRRANYQLSHSEMLDIAFNYADSSKNNHHDYSIDESAPRIGGSNDCMEFLDFSHINITKKMDEFVVELCSEILHLREAKVDREECGYSDSAPAEVNSNVVFDGKLASEDMDVNEQSVWVVDPALDNLAGHHRPLNECLFKLSQNDDRSWRFFAHCSAQVDFPVTACFRDRPYIQENDGMSWLQLATVYARSFAEDLQTYLTPQIGIHPPILLFHSITLPMLLGLADWLELQPAASLPEAIGLHFIVEPIHLASDHDLAESVARDVMGRIIFHAKSNDIRLTITAQNQPVMEAWCNAGATGVIAVPPPSASTPTSRTRQQDGRVRLLFIGTPRIEKGYQLLMKSLIQLLTQIPLLDVRFVCAISDTAIESNVHANGRVSVEMQAYIPEEQYYSEIANADLIYCAYLPTDYKYKSSNIFWEAQAFGVPALVMAGTSLAMDAQAVDGLGAIVVEGPEPELLIAACRQASEEIERYRAEAIAVSELYAELLSGRRWMEYHLQ